MRWIGPEKGVIHLALGAVVNAAWDLWAKVLGKPVWRIVADMTPEEFVRCIDFRYITDAITPDEAIALLKETEGGKAERIRDAEASKAVPAYTTSAGWLGYGEDKMKALLTETAAAGYKYFKLKVGGSLEDDRHRLGIARDVLGYDKGNVLMVDANQIWSVPEAIERLQSQVMEMDLPDADRENMEAMLSGWLYSLHKVHDKMSSRPSSGEQRS